MGSETSCGRLSRWTAKAPAFGLSCRSARYIDLSFMLMRGLRQDLRSFPQAAGKASAPSTLDFWHSACRGSLTLAVLSAGNSRRISGCTRREGKISSPVLVTVHLLQEACSYLDVNLLSEQICLLASSPFDEQCQVLSDRVIHVAVIAMYPATSLALRHPHLRVHLWDRICHLLDSEGVLLVWSQPR